MSNRGINFLYQIKTTTVENVKATGLVVDSLDKQVPINKQN